MVQRSEFRLAGQGQELAAWTYPGVPERPGGSSFDLDRTVRTCETGVWVVLGQKPWPAQAPSHAGNLSHRESSSQTARLAHNVGVGLGDCWACDVVIGWARLTKLVSAWIDRGTSRPSELNDSIHIAPCGSNSSYRLARHNDGFRAGDGYPR